MKGLRIADQLTLSTVRLEVGIEVGKVRLGTGFFFRAGSIDDWPLTLVITNRHVIDGVGDVKFFTSTADANGLPIAGADDSFTLTRNIVDELRVDHPDPEVDLCGIITWPMVDAAKKQGNQIGQRHLSEKNLVGDQDLNDLSAIEDVILIGYPVGLWDQLHNRPIVRRGITATHARLSYNGRAEFLIDSAAFPGSSGSPVFLYRPELHLDGDEFLITAVPKLLGILAEAPRHTETAAIENAFALSDKGATATYDVPLNLGTVLQARRLRELAVHAEHRANEVKILLSPSIPPAG